MEPMDGPYRKQRFIMFSALFLSLWFGGCSGSLDERDLEKLNGYWQIERVTLADGSEREYPMGPSIDFIHWDGQSGYRKKVQPRMNGTFGTSADAEPFRIVEKHGHGSFITYRKGASGWQEKIEEIGSNHLVLEDETGVRYRYKRYEPLNVE